MGKSGSVGRKLAATFSSTGTSAFFMHPAEAVHGDLGMIEEEDVVLAISYSGYTDEIQSILVPLERIGPKMVAMTGDDESVLARSADVVLDTSVDQEAGPMDLAPTASTTATIALGDALAVALLQERDFAREDFARFHPKGSLGKKLLLKVNDIMHTDDEVPLVTPDISMKDALLEMTDKRLGITGIVNEDGELIGCITDGDLRRILEEQKDRFFDSDLRDVMTADPLTISGDQRAVEALDLMEDYQITVLFVTDDENKPTGAVHMHDILREGITENDS
jgi:arabinose-5-phosphate isomerase